MYKILVGPSPNKWEDWFPINSNNNHHVNNGVYKFYTCHVTKKKGPDSQLSENSYIISTKDPISNTKESNIHLIYHMKLLRHHVKQDQRRKLCSSHFLLGVHPLEMERKIDVNMATK